MFDKSREQQARMKTPEGRVRASKGGAHGEWEENNSRVVFIRSLLLNKDTNTNRVSGR